MLYLDMRLPSFGFRRPASNYQTGSGLLIKPSNPVLTPWLKQNWIAIISLVVAIVAALGSIWQAKTTIETVSLMRQQIALSDRQFQEQFRQAREDAKTSNLGAAQQLKLAENSIEISQKNARSAAQSAAATIQSARAAQQQLELANRPWLTVHPEISSLDFGELGVVITLRLRLRNIGHSPATHVQAIAEAHVGSVDLEAARRNSCGPGEANFRKHLYSSTLKRSTTESLNSTEEGDFTVFPKEESYSDVFLQTGRLEVQEFFAQAGDLAQKYGFHQNGVTPAVVGCVNYYFDFDHSQHQTGFAYWVKDAKAKDDAGRVITGPIPTPPDKTPPISDLKLVRAGLFKGFSAY